MAQSYTSKSGQKVTTHYDDVKKNREMVEKREASHRENKSKVPLSQKIGNAAHKVVAKGQERGREMNEQHERRESPRQERREHRAPTPSMRMMTAPAPSIPADPFGVGGFGGFGREPTRAAPRRRPPAPAPRKKRRASRPPTGIPDSMRWMF